MIADLVCLLARDGPALTSTLAAKLRAAGRSPEAARKCLSRLPESVRVLHGLPFPKRARFIYLESQFGKDRYWQALTTAVKGASPAYSAALSGLRARGGVVPRAQVDVACGAPVKQKGQLSAATIISRLSVVQLVKEIYVDRVGDCVCLNDYSVSMPEIRARLLTEGILLDALRRWASRMNMVSPKVTTIRGEARPPTFATCRFDLCGPSYLRPLRRWKDGKPDPGFLVADVLMGKTLDEEDVQPFIRKCTLLGQLRKIRPFLPMLIADGFTGQALGSCRREGITATTPDTLFGEGIGRALSDLVQTLSNAAAVAAVDPDRIMKLFTSLSKIEGAAGNLRGALFELIVGHAVRSIEGGSIDIGVVVQDKRTGARAEVDVRLIRERNAFIYECKGHQASAIIRKDQVEKWLTEQVPVIASAHRQEQRFDGGRLRFEFWTCGSFDPGALDFLIEAQARTKKYEIGWKNGAEILAYTRELAAPGIKKILLEHYFRACPKLGQFAAAPRRCGGHGARATRCSAREAPETGSRGVFGA